MRLTLIDACYLHGGIGEAPEGAQRRFSDGDAEAWARRVDELAEDERSGSAPRSTACARSIPSPPPPSRRWAVRARARPCTRTCPSSRPRTRPASPRTGGTPTALLADAGALDGALHRGPRDAPDATRTSALLGGAAACCCVCPTTERDLADGIGRMSTLAEAGAALSLGSDSHAVIDLFEEARAVELDERLASGERGIHSPAALLRAATGSGHACLGWDDAGPHRAPAPAPTWSPSSLDGVRLAGHPPATTPSPPSSSPRAPRTCAT